MNKFFLSVLTLSACAAQLLAYQAPPVDETPYIQVNNPQDQQIVYNIYSKIRRDYYLSPYADQITVNSYNGVVVLTGTINSTNANIRIEKMARNTSRVKQVINNILINSTPPYVPPI